MFKADSTEEIFHPEEDIMDNIEVPMNEAEYEAWLAKQGVGQIPTS